MSIYNFDEFIDRTGTHTVKYDLRDAVFGNKEVIPMWVADMDFKTPDFIVEAVKKRAEHPIYGYTIRPDSFNESIINWMKKRHNWNIKKDWLTFSPGVVPALVMCVLAFTKPGDKIIIQSPVYFPFFSTIEGNGRQLTDNPLKEKNGKFVMDFEDLKSKIDSRTKMLILCSPHNPVGRVWSKEELQELSNICLENNMLIISDEIHSDLVFSKHKHIPLASISQEIADNTITCMAPSKTFNIAGLNTAEVIISNKNLLNDFNNKMNDYHLFIANIFGTTALEAAYNSGEPWLNEMLEYVWNNYITVNDFIKKNTPKIKVFEPEGTYLLWLDFKAMNLSRQELMHFIIDKAGVGLNSGFTFGVNGEYFLRMNIACPNALVKKSLMHIEKAYKQIYD